MLLSASLSALHELLFLVSFLVYVRPQQPSCPCPSPSSSCRYQQLPFPVFSSLSLACAPLLLTSALALVLLPPSHRLPFLSSQQLLLALSVYALVPWMLLSPAASFPFPFLFPSFALPLLLSSLARELHLPYLPLLSVSHRQLLPALFVYAPAL